MLNVVARSRPPLQGWYLIYQILPCASGVFVPLRGLDAVGKSNAGYHVVFAPPYGDGIITFSILVPTNKFSPPYGDCTTQSSNALIAKSFSPPYGDCTITMNIIAKSASLSPPYGDRTDPASSLVVDG